MKEQKPIKYKNFIKTTELTNIKSEFEFRIEPNWNYIFFSIYYTSSSVLQTTVLSKKVHVQKNKWLLFVVV